MREKDRFVYVPRIKSDGCLYNGNPLVHKEAYEILGDEGVKELDDFIKQIVETRKKVITSMVETAYGLPVSFHVFDFKHKILLSVSMHGLNEFEKPDYVGEARDNSYKLFRVDWKKFQNIGDRAFKNEVNRWLYKNLPNALAGLSKAEKEFYRKDFYSKNKDYFLKRKVRKN